MSTIIKDGYVFKRGGGQKNKKFPSMKNWHTRWVVLVPGTIYYYNQAGEKDAKAFVDLEKATLNEMPEDLKTDREFCAIVSNDETEFVMSFFDQADKDDWIKNIKAQIGKPKSIAPVATTIPQKKLIR